MNITAQMPQVAVASYADQLADALGRQRRVYYDAYDFALGNVMLDVANALANAGFDFNYRNSGVAQAADLHQPVLDHIHWMLNSGSGYIHGFNAEDIAAYELAASFATQIYSTFE